MGYFTTLVESMSQTLKTFSFVFSNIHMITHSQDISFRQKHSTKSGNITTGLDFPFFVKDYCRLCTTCSHSKLVCHKPYGLLKQLPVPSNPWNSISMDFIEKLPPSSGYTSILVIVDCLSKQSLFIPTYNTIMSPHLAQPFVLHVFSKLSELVARAVRVRWGSDVGFSSCTAPTY